LLGLPEIDGRFSYTAVLGTTNVTAFRSQLEQYMKVGFRDYKIKLFGMPEIDKQNTHLVGDKLGEGTTLRFDANNLWKNADEAIKYLSNMNANYFAVEEPIDVQDFSGLSKISEMLGKKIILDESFLKRSDFDYLGSSLESWIINLRISKMGGVIRSLEIAEKAKQVGVPIIIGAQVGETSILTRAALTVANTCKDNLVAQEGAYGTHLLSYDLLNPSLMFGAEGVLDVGADKLVLRS